MLPCVGEATMIELSNSAHFAWVVCVAGGGRVVGGCVCM